MAEETCTHGINYAECLRQKHILLVLLDSFMANKNIPRKKETTTTKKKKKTMTYDIHNRSLRGVNKLSDYYLRKRVYSERKELAPKNSNITKTCLYNNDPLKPNFYPVKLGFIGVYIIFLISAQKHRLWVLLRTASLRRF